MSINCKCGAVKIVLADPQAIWRLHCCCYDCNAAIEYFAKVGGPPAPDFPQADSIWFKNDFQVEGIEDVGVMKNFEGGDSTRFYCKKCQTLLAADFPVYAGKIFVTQSNSYTDFKALKGCELITSQARHFLKDLSAEDRARLPAWDGDADSRKVLTGLDEETAKKLEAFGNHDGQFEDVSQNFFAAAEKILGGGSTGQTMNIQILTEKCGPALIPDAKEHGYLTAGPPTMLSKMAAAAAEKPAA